MNPAPLPRSMPPTTSLGARDDDFAGVPRSRRSFARYAWAVLAFNLLVILWGAYVRATGSGAGCGSHWPLCNGEIVPRAPALATAIEFTHRVTSGLALLLVGGLGVAAWRRYPAGDAVRRAAAMSGFFIVVEALLGAGLVLLEYVADDTRAARGFWVAAHLANTLILIAALALTAWWAPARATRRKRAGGATIAALAIALGGMLVLGMSGAITALGDTLFPASTWEEGKAQTFAATAHVFVRLRLWHPALALAVGVAIFLAAGGAVRERPDAVVRRLAISLVGLYLAELFLGLANVRLLAPIELQMAHLLLADLAWIALVLLTAEVAVPGRRFPPNRPDAPPR
jgi:heme A synthase